MSEETLHKKSRVRCEKTSNADTESQSAAAGDSVYGDFRAVDRYAGWGPSVCSSWVPLRFTPGFMLSPAIAGQVGFRR
jgi:hypothetical protein